MTGADPVGERQRTGEPARHADKPLVAQRVEQRRRRGAARRPHTPTVDQVPGTQALGGGQVLKPSGTGRRLDGGDLQVAVAVGAEDARDHPEAEPAVLVVEQHELEIVAVRASIKNFSH